MNENTTTVAAAAGSGAAALALVVILQWVLSLYKVALPADVATAFATVIATSVHWFVVQQKALVGSNKETKQ